MKKNCSVNEPKDVQVDYLDEYPAGFFEATEAYTQEETEFYHALAKRFRGKVLELGCGTGKHIHRLAKMGHECWGLDIMPQFIEHATRALGSHSGSDGSAHFVIGDMVRFEIGQMFSVIFVTCGSLYQIIRVEDRVQLAQCAARHLIPGGVLCLATEFFFDKASRGEPVEDGLRCVQRFKRTFELKGKTYEAQQTRYFNPITQLIEGEERVFDNAGAGELVLSRNILAHVSTPDELELMLVSAGLKVIEQYGHSDGRQLDMTKLDQGWMLMLGQEPEKP